MASKVIEVSAYLTKAFVLFANERLGLDKEITDYIFESNDLLLKAVGEPMLLLKAKDSGDLVQPTVITSWDKTTPQYKKRIWTLGDLNHPDVRRYVNNGK